MPTTLIARACLGVLLHNSVDENVAAPTPLARYAAEHWVTHARVKNVVSRIRDGMERLFDPEAPYFSSWVKLYNVDGIYWVDKPHLQTQIQRGVVPLYYAAFCGLREIVEHLVLKYPQYTNSIRGGAGTALHTASHQRHVYVVRSLLKCGADVNARGSINSSPLHLAVNYSLGLERLEVVRVLLKHNADFNSQDTDDLTPIHYVFLYGVPRGDCPPVVRLLLEHGANPNARDNKRRKPLHLVSSSLVEEFSSEWVISSWLLEVSRILLEHGADVDAEDKEGRSPMQVALAKGQAELVQLLLEYSSKHKCNILHMLATTRTNVRYDALYVFFSPVLCSIILTYTYPGMTA